MSNRDIPVVVFAGGKGARFDHETQATPKPMINVCGKPIIDHIIDGFRDQGFREFIVLTGYLGDVIDRHFQGLAEQKKFDRYFLGGDADGATVQVIDTGEEAHTGQRLWRARASIGNRRFILTYGDGLSDVDMTAVIDSHEFYGADVTMTAVRPPGRFGIIDFDPLVGPPAVLRFCEKSANDWINGGFMVVESRFIDSYINEGLELESTALPNLASLGGLYAYRHRGFWACMDTRRDRDAIEQIASNSGSLPWRKFS